MKTDWPLILLSPLAASCSIGFVSPVTESGTPSATPTTAPTSSSQCSDNADPIDGVCADEFRIFVTSSTQAGDHGGLDGADTICNNHASSATPALSRTYVAILSSGTVDARDRITAEGKIYKFTDSETRVQVAESETDLWDADSTNLLTTIDRDESTNEYTGNVWTGTESNGQMSANHCSGFMDSTMGFAGDFGSSSAVNSGWINSSNGLCSNSSRAIYCISQ